MLKPFYEDTAEPSRGQIRRSGLKPKAAGKRVTESTLNDRVITASASAIRSTCKPNSKIPKSETQFQDSRINPSFPNSQSQRLNPSFPNPDPVPCSGCRRLLQSPVVDAADPVVDANAVVAALAAAQEETGATPESSHCCRCYSCRRQRRLRRCSTPPLNGVVLDILVEMGIIRSHHFWLDVEHIQEAIQNVLVCLEMAIFSVLQQYAFHHAPYSGDVETKMRLREKDE
ncbi:hypothetical protein RJ639_042725 [Escallonia herrerae]|uniref:Uncharacterized protein n=1 Tax=Escallonia herrerae TaxID=1293975 RepID=A0AA89B1D9_9ASTE|nr:hypothetical protein RJ639_042725 [Escallonia herrerae]